MRTEQALQMLSDKETYSRDDLHRVLCSEEPDLSDSAFRWTLYNLQQEQKIFRTS